MKRSILAVENFMINGLKWSITVLDGDYFESKFGSQEAVTLGEQHQIYINDEDNISRATLRHELVHAWYSSLPLRAARLSARQVEEVLAELFGTYGPEIIKQASHLYNKLKD